MSVPDVFRGKERFPPAINLDAIFIARDEQVRRFRHYLARWLQESASADTEARGMFSAPSPDYPLQGLLVLLSGEGGLGKTTLLKHLHAVAAEAHDRLTVSAILDWELLSVEHTMLPNPSPGQSVEEIGYYELLRWQLARALGRNLADFQTYREALATIEVARQQAQEVLLSLRPIFPVHGQEGPLNPLRWLGGEMLLQIIRWFAELENAPTRVSEVQVESQLRQIVSGRAEVSLEHAEQLYTRFKSEFDSRLTSYLNPALHLGLALGEDLRVMSGPSPLLLFFDTYEKINEEDKWLRIVMHAAGGRVGWVLAGRDSLLEASLQSNTLDYGYREIVPPAHLLALNFNTAEEKISPALARSSLYPPQTELIATFSPGDIMNYFSALHEQMPEVPAIRLQDARRIQRATRGLPLAVRIAADLYLRKPDLRLITQEMKGGPGMERMVRRYLRYVLNEPEELAQIYALALPRRLDEPEVVLKMLALPVQDTGSYGEILYHLQRRYSFILNSEKQPRLHEEVRYFLRLWLWEHRREPLPKRLIARLREVQHDQLARRETRLAYSSLRQRFEDDEWIEIYLDLLEAQFWFDPIEGIRSGLAFLCASSIYQRHARSEVAVLGSFFVADAPPIYRDWWNQATQCLQSPTSYDASPASIVQLEALVALLREQPAFFCEPLAEWKDELEAALWWRLAEAHFDGDKNKALSWYRWTLTRLWREPSLREIVTRLYVWRANQLYESGQYRESIECLDEALNVELHSAAISSHQDNTTFSADIYYNQGNAYFALEDLQQACTSYQKALMYNPRHERAYMNLGNVYFERKEYLRAIDEYSRALALETPDSGQLIAHVLYNRANARVEMQEYAAALNDFDRAINLQPSLGSAYINRGHLHGLQGNYQQAINDYNQAAELEPTNINAVWTAMWANFGPQPIDKTSTTKLEAIAALDPQHYIAALCRGIIISLRHADFAATLAEIERALAQEPEQWDSYFWKGITCAYQERDQEAKQALEAALHRSMPPLLLMPLYWLRGRRPDFFQACALPLLQRYRL